MPDAIELTVDDAATGTASDGLPARIPFARIEDVLHAIGLEVSDCISLTFGINGVTVERIRTMDDGRALAVGNDLELATITTVIGYSGAPHSA